MVGRKREKKKKKKKPFHHHGLALCFSLDGGRILIVAAVGCECDWNLIWDSYVRECVCEWGST